MRYERRKLLRALGYGAALGPFVPLLDREAEAQGVPTRLLLIATGNGSVPSRFWPTGGETNFSFAPGSITEPLAPWKSKLIFPNGLRRVQTGEGAHEGAWVPLWNQGSRAHIHIQAYSAFPSVDQIAAQGIPRDTPFPSLEFAVMNKSIPSKVLHIMSYAGKNLPVYPEPNPYKMFDRLRMEAGGDAGLSVEDLARNHAAGKSSIDLLRGELHSLAGRIGAVDRIKLDQHLASLREIEMRLGPAPVTTTPAQDMAFSVGAPRAGIDLTDNESFPEILAVQNSLAVAALASRQTRVASVMWGCSFNETRHTWAGVSMPHHALSHQSTPEADLQMQAIERWFMGRLADLLGQLDAVKEGNGTLLDHTMVIYCNELNRGDRHSAGPAITLIAGGGGGKLRTGRFLNLPRNHFSQLLCTACHVMGLPQVERVGDKGLAGDLSALRA